MQFKATIYTILQMIHPNYYAYDLPPEAFTRMLLFGFERMEPYPMLSNLLKLCVMR